MTRILLIEDDRLLGESLVDFLEKNGYTVRWIDDDRDVMHILNIEAFDIVVLDLILKFSNGENFIKKIKNKFSDLPIIITTAKSSIDSKEECFKLGADDYITKPFVPKELILRIDAILKRIYKTDTVEKIQSAQINLDKKTLTVNEKEILLTEKEWVILEFLIKKRNKIVTYNDILNYVWPGKDVGEESVRTYIKKLRSKLPENSIETLKGRGYRLK